MSTCSGTIQSGANKGQECGKPSKFEYEGDYYISQVPAEYNLGLYGEGLEELLAGETKQLNLDGHFELFEESLNYALKCSGTLQ